MRELLRDPYYGNITPNEQDIRPGSPLQKAMEQAEDPARAIDAFLQKKLAGSAGDPAALKRAGDALARRGYSWEEVREGLNRWGADLEPED